MISWFHHTNRNCKSMLTVVLVLGLLGCARGPEYSQIEGKVQILVTYDGITSDGIALSIPLDEVIITDDTGTQYRGLLAPDMEYADTPDGRRRVAGLDVIRSGCRYRCFGIHRTLQEVHERYRKAGGTGVYYPEDSFKSTKFFDVHRVELVK